MNGVVKMKGVGTQKKRLKRGGNRKLVEMKRRVNDGKNRKGGDARRPWSRK